MQFRNNSTSNPLDTSLAAHSAEASSLCGMSWHNTACTTVSDNAVENETNPDANVYSIQDAFSFLYTPRTIPIRAAS
jgi:hypothetical protein